LRLDEAFAPAHAQLAIATWHLENRVSRPNLEQARRTASRHIDRAQEIEPELAEAYAGRALLALGDDQNAAVNFAQKALLLNPSYTEVMNWLYIALLRLGRYEEYVATLEALLEKDPLNPIGQWNYITMLARQGRITEADDFAGSDMIDNSGRGSYLDLVTAIPWRGDIADGILSHLIYRAEFPTRRTEIDELVQAFVWIGEYDEARRLDPDLAFLVDVAEGRFDSAILATQSRMQQNPENQSSIQAAANVLYAAGRIDGALPLFESLLALRPKGLPLADGEATMRLAFGRRSAGNEQGAQEIAEIVRKDQAARHAAGFHNQYENRTKAMLAAFDGEPDRVIAEFKTAIDIGLRDPLVFADPIFEGLRDDPRFVKLKEGLDVILAREREKVLQLICFNNPTPDNWQPLPETCEGVERRKE
jgi:tetratricopeptide (TPR) repeat protein